MLLTERQNQKFLRISKVHTEEEKQVMEFQSSIG